MIPTGIAAVLVLVSLLISSLLAVLVGYFTCIILRLPWGFATSATDILLAPVIAFASAGVLFKIDSAHGDLHSRLGLLLGLACGAVVVRHLIRLRLRSAD
jgi:hypothetical protein